MWEKEGNYLNLVCQRFEYYKMYYSTTTFPTFINFEIKKMWRKAGSIGVFQEIQGQT